MDTRVAWFKPPQESSPGQTPANGLPGGAEHTNPAFPVKKQSLAHHSQPGGGGQCVGSGHQ